MLNATLSLGLPSPAPSENLRAWLYVLLGKGGVWEAVQPTHGEPCFALASHQRRSFTDGNILPWSQKGLFDISLPRRLKKSFQVYNLNFFPHPSIPMQVPSTLPYPTCTTHPDLCICAGPTSENQDSLFYFAMTILHCWLDRWIFSGKGEGLCGTWERKHCFCFGIYFLDSVTVSVSSL